jgi:5-methyltetrahydrofolate--homocysteine methyltransferase
MTVRERLDAIAAERILILDGAMGSMIQGFRLGEEDFRGSRFARWPQPLKGCNDLLCLTKPEVISSIHEDYLKAGADIIETCSLNSTAVSLADYGLGDLAYELSRAAAALGRKAADAWSRPEKPRFVAGSIGPTSRSASISPDMDDPGKRGIAWDELEGAYYDQVGGLLDGGADVLLLETMFDTLNVKAALFAIFRILEERGIDVPVMISATVADAGGRLLSGQTVEAFCVSVLHARPWSLGLNCSFGAERLQGPVRDIAAAAPCLVSAYPNAGMPNQMGDYDESPETMAAWVDAYMREGLVNIVGGCCGSTPAHIAAIAAKAKNRAPRRVPAPRGETCLAGLEVLRVNRDRGLTGIGERTNVAGSRKFLRLIKEGNYGEALGIAREMINAGAAVIDICMDDALLDAGAAMNRFVSLALADPDIARVPFMIDSSRWDLIEGALKLIQGKALVNSISLKEGEGEFLRRAALIRRCGAAAVVMLFDEQGQAADYERKIAVAERCFKLLTAAGFPAGDIVFDPNVLAIATGIGDHDRYALDFIRACAWIRDHCPGAQISGGISNLSFSFRGNDRIREAMHAVFLKHAREAGLSMAIVNPAALVPWEGIEPRLRDAAEDLVLCKNTAPATGPGTGTGTEDASPTARLLALAEETARTAGKPGGPGKAGTGAPPAEAAWRDLPPEERIVEAMLRGLDDFIEADVLELRRRYGRSMEIVEGPLMRGMGAVGERFGAGKMFLPQVIRSARVMKKAVAVLEPFIQAEKAAGTREARKAGRVLIATVKGDVHDIGKNIAGVVLGCNGYEVLDLGVMVPAERIIAAALDEKVDVAGLSGLITPSLDEMINTAAEMEKRGLKIPLLIGGAAASLAHTALRIAPVYSGPVVYVNDAGSSAAAVRALLSPAGRPRFLEALEQSYREAAARHESIRTGIQLASLEEARRNKVPSPPSFETVPPRTRGLMELNGYDPSGVIPRIDWDGFLRAWELGGPKTAPEQGPVRDELLESARKLLDRIAGERLLELRGVLGFFPASPDGDDLVLRDPAESGGKEIARFSFLRNQEKKRAGGPNPCLADFVPREGWIGLFALSAGFGLEEARGAYRGRGDDYGALLLSTLANALTEAFAEEVHHRVRREWWGYAPDREDSFPGIRPAFGYPACPDHRDKETAFRLLEARQRCGLELSDTAMIIPAASICGLFLAHPAAYYFGAGPIGDDQLEDWARRKGISPGEARKRIARI